MSRSPRGTSAVAVLGAVSLVLAACSAGDGGDTSASSSAAADDTGDGTEQAPVERGDGTLVIGSLLPQTGTLAYLGPAEFAGVQLAVDDVNAAGGFKGADVVYHPSDSGDAATDTASQSVQALLSARADAVIGAASSSVTFTVIDAITGAGAVQVSPANTSPELTTYPDHGLYSRTAPDDLLQGRALGDLVLQDGHRNVATITLDDPSSSALQQNIAEVVEQGGGTVVENSVFSADDTTFDAVASQVAASTPDAIVVISLDQAVSIVEALAARHVGPADVQVYFYGGNLSNYADAVPAGTLTGVKGTSPGAATSNDLRQRLLSVDPGLTDTTFASEAYDATVLVALAAQAAGNDSGTGIAARMRDVSEVGEKCTTYRQCLDLLTEGSNIDYDGLSGPLEFDAHGDVTQASFAVYQYGPDNTVTNIGYVSGSR